MQQRLQKVQMQRAMRWGPAVIIFMVMILVIWQWKRRKPVVPVSGAIDVMIAIRC